MERLMSLELNKQVALESVRVLESGETTAAEPIVAPDFINHEADDPDRSDRGIRGPAGLVAISRWLREVFSELRFDQSEAVGEGEHVVTVMMTGTQSGPFRASPRRTSLFSSVRFIYSQCATDKSSSIRRCGTTSAC